jgi:hypothetical protein
MKFSNCTVRILPVQNLLGFTLQIFPLSFFPTFYFGLFVLFSNAISIWAGTAIEKTWMGHILHWKGLWYVYLTLTDWFESHLTWVIELFHILR